MKTLDPKAAAEEIHAAVNTALATDHPDPKERHELDYITRVCNCLGIEPTPHNLTIIARELSKAEIVPHLVQEYPKVVGQRERKDGKGNVLVDEHNRPIMEDVIAHNEDEEAEFGGGEAPDPAPAPDPHKKHAA